MSYQLSAACACDMGRIRRNNEDNIYFNGAVMEEINQGLRGVLSTRLAPDLSACFAVFDGMGGEELGEKASFSAASALAARLRGMEKTVAAPRKLLLSVCAEMNDAVCAEREKEPGLRMGSTVVMLLFLPEAVFVCNVGDSRAYRLSGSRFARVSMDHVEQLPPSASRRKTALTQNLGLFHDELTLEPYIAGGAVRTGDIYLLCSDGLSDMLSDKEIGRCLLEHRKDVRQAASALVSRALENGGRDNVTVMVIKVEGGEQNE